MVETSKVQYNWKDCIKASLFGPKIVQNIVMGFSSQLFGRCNTTALLHSSFPFYLGLLQPDFQFHCLRMPGKHTNCLCSVAVHSRKCNNKKKKCQRKIISGHSPCKMQLAITQPQKALLTKYPGMLQHPPSLYKSCFIADLSLLYSQA